MEALPRPLRRIAGPPTPLVACLGMAVVLGVAVVAVHWQPLLARLFWRTLSCCRRWGGGPLAR